jgi:hypothetical protein
VPTPPLFKTEADMCDRLIQVARAHGFLVFPEAGGFDLLLVATADANGFEPGTQVGVEAKLRANMHVLHQALPRDWGQTPHCFAVLVPEGDDFFIEIARRLKITVIEAINLGDAHYDLSFLRWYKHEPKQVCFVPGVEIFGTRGGCPSPKRLSKWKLNAVRLCLLHDEKGYLTSKDFEEAEINKGLFYKEGWFLEERERVVVDGRSLARYRLDATKKLPHLVYPEIAEAIRKSMSA